MTRRYRSYYDTGEFENHRGNDRSGIEVNEPEPWVDIGLVDAYGYPIVRFQGLETIGFLSD